LFIKPFNLFIHAINEMILLLLRLFQVNNALLSPISRSACDCYLRLHHLVVLAHLLQCAVQLVQLFLCLCHSFELFFSFFLLSFELFLQHFMLLLSINPILLNDIVVVMCSLKRRLHLRQLVLHTVELDTCLFTGLLHFSHLFFL
jgi:hypothetical protein